MEYKPVSDARLSLGLRVLEFLSGLGEHLMLPMGVEGEALGAQLQGAQSGEPSKRNRQHHCGVEHDEQAIEEAYAGGDRARQVVARLN